MQLQPRPVADPRVVRRVASTAIARDPGTFADQVGKQSVRILNVRGWFGDLKRPRVNDFGTYDDAGFIIDDRIGFVASFNVNTDPSRTGQNKALGHLYAQLVAQDSAQAAESLLPGVWPMRLGPHRGEPGFLRQMDDEEAALIKLAECFGKGDHRAHGDFLVTRVTDDDARGRREWGHQAINYHRGGMIGTSSWGCQTAREDQCDEFFDTVYKLCGQDRKHSAWQLLGHCWVPVILIDREAWDELAG